MQIYIYIMFSRKINDINVQSSFIITGLTQPLLCYPSGVHSQFVCRVRVTQSLVFRVTLCRSLLSLFHLFLSNHCIICLSSMYGSWSSMYGSWLLLWFLQNLSYIDTMELMFLLNVVWGLYYFSFCSLVLAGTFCLYYSSYRLNNSLILSHINLFKFNIKLTLNVCPIFHNTVFFHFVW